MNVKLSADSARYLKSQDKCLQDWLISVIRDEAQRPAAQMVVTGWTCDLPDHIYRAMKTYIPRPGYRIIFHMSARDCIVIDRIARRDQNPYGDGH